MIDLKQIFPILTAKFVGVVTIMVFSSACAHELFIRPSNNDSGSAQQLTQMTPEPVTPVQTAPVVAKHRARTGKHIAKHTHKAHKNLNIARNSHKQRARIHTAAAIIASRSTAPAPQIAPPPQIPAPLASASTGVKPEIDADSGFSVGTFVIFGLAALAIFGLIWVAPRARRTTKPKRKLLYNG